MTREEANQIAAASLDAEKWNSSGIVRTLCALGLLKLDEPKSVIDQTYDALVCFDRNRSEVRDIIDELSRAGLKIVEK